MSEMFPDDRAKEGRIILSTPSMQMMEIKVYSTLFDTVLLEKLDMEGGRTGRHAVCSPSVIQTVPA